jgi:hypothetical protein
MYYVHGIRRLEGCSTKDCSLSDQIAYHNTTCSLNKVSVESQLCCIIKQDIDKLLAIGFIKLVEETTWFFLIVVISKKNGKLRIYADFRKLNATKKDL